MKIKQTEAQLLLRTHLRELGIKVSPGECCFFVDRKWRLDLYLPELRIGIECSGGKWTGGHRRGNRVDDEYEKLNTATMMGIRVLQFTNEYILDGRARQFIENHLQREEGKNEENAGSTSMSRGDRMLGPLRGVRKGGARHR